MSIICNKIQSLTNADMISESSFFTVSYNKKTFGISIHHDYPIDSSTFNDNNIKKDVEIRFIELINHCEFARYSPSNNKDKQMSGILSSAKKIIIDVESELK